MIDFSTIVFGWGVGPHGWGTTGLNWMLHWPGTALCALPELNAELPPSDSRWPFLTGRVGQSAALQNTADLSASELPMFVALGNDFAAALARTGRPLHGVPTIAMPFFEDTALGEKHVDQLRKYPLVVAASAWNRDWLVAQGIPAQLCHQGYDPVIFHPGVRRPRDDGRFRIFSGGKAEYRKSQDIVLQAFGRFAERHDDAVLVAAWGSPWASLAASFSDTPVGAPPGSEIGMPNFRAWAQRAGIKPHQIEIVPPQPNWMMAKVYGGVDCAIFPNRIEGGTNLVAMECMACGVPTIAELSTGQRDLAGYVTFGAETGGDPDYFVEQLETAYCSTPFPGCLGPEWTWPARLAELRGIVGDELGNFLPSIIADDNLAAMARLAEAAPPGNFVEVGVYRGGSARVLYQIAQRRNAALHLFDTFCGMPVADAVRGDKHLIGEFADIDLSALRQALPAAKFHVGCYPQTHVDCGPVAFVHCDCDQYASYRAVIERMWPLVVPGGLMLFDDYPYLPGAKAAVEESFSLDELRPTGTGRHYVRKA